MTYVAFRAAPLGRCMPAAVTAAFFGFHASRIDGALPAAWEICTPEDAEAARRRSAAEALRRLWGSRLAGGSRLDALADQLWEISQRVDVAGRPLAAANRALPRPEDGVERLWQATTTLREHRGDGHNCVLVSRDLGPVDAHHLKILAGESDADILQRSRNWPIDEWAAGMARLEAKGLVRDGKLTTPGSSLRQAVERETDVAARAPWRGLDRGEMESLADALAPLTRAVVASGELPANNPVGMGPLSIG